MEEVDVLSDESRVTRLLVRDRQLIYGCEDGVLIVKQSKK